MLKSRTTLTSITSGSTHLTSKYETSDYFFDTAQFAITMLSTRLAARAARVAAQKTPTASSFGVRTFAAPANSAATKPPVALFGIDGTYASALVRRSPQP